jgi:hypothetical protein
MHDCGGPSKTPFSFHSQPPKFPTPFGSKNDEVPFATACLHAPFSQLLSSLDLAQLHSISTPVHLYFDLLSLCSPLLFFDFVFIENLKYLYKNLSCSLNQIHPVVFLPPVHLLSCVFHSTSFTHLLVISCILLALICKVGGVQSGQGPVLDRSDHSEHL